MAAPRSSQRHRQRSHPVTLSVALLVVATVAALASLPTRSALWLSLASLATVALAWGSLRMMWSEVLASRHENAADRAAAAAEYRALSGARTAEHTEFTAAMVERLAQAHLAQRELEGLVTQYETRVQRAHTMLRAEQRRVQVLETDLALSRTVGGEAAPSLMTWEEQIRREVAAKYAEPGDALKHA